MFDSMTMWCFFIATGANIRDSKKGTRLRNTTDPFWWLLEPYSSDWARHKDADIIGGEVRWHSKRLQLPVEEEEEGFVLHQQKHEKLFFAFFLMLCSWMCNQPDAAKEKENNNPPTHRKWFLFLLLSLM